MTVENDLAKVAALAELVGIMADFSRAADWRLYG